MTTIIIIIILSMAMNLPYLNKILMLVLWIFKPIALSFAYGTLAITILLMRIVEPRTVDYVIAKVIDYEIIDDLNGENKFKKNPVLYMFKSVINSVKDIRVPILKQMMNRGR